MRIEFLPIDRKRESPAARVIRALALGWLVYGALFLILDRYASYLDISFLLGWEARYTDFFEVNYWAAEGGAYLTGYCANYPPLALLIAKFFALFTPNTLNLGTVPTRNSQSGHVLYAVFAALVAAAALILLWLLLRRMPEARKDPVLPAFFALALCCGYSFLFALDRGNYIVLSYLFFLGFLLLYEKHERAAGVMLALCACTKVYPVVFFLLFLVDKKYKGFLWGMAAGVAGLFLPMLFLRGSFVEQFTGFLSGVLNFNSTSQMTQSGFDFAHLERHSNSFTNLFRWIAMLIARSGAPGGVKAAFIRVLAALGYTGAVLILLLLVVTFLFSRERWQRVFLLAALICLLPNNTYDYMLIFFLPIIAMILATGDRAYSRHAALLTLLACVPKCYYFFPNRGEDLSIQCILNPLLLVAVVLLLFTENALPRLKERWAARRRAA